MNATDGLHLTKSTPHRLPDWTYRFWLPLSGFWSHCFLLRDKLPASKTGTLSDVFTMPSGGSWLSRITTDRPLVPTGTMKLLNGRPTGMVCVWDQRTCSYCSSWWWPAEKITDFAVGEASPRWMPDFGRIHRHGSNEITQTNFFSLIATARGLAPWPQTPSATTGMPASWWEIHRFQSCLVRRSQSFDIILFEIATGNRPRCMENPLYAPCLQSGLQTGNGFHLLHRRLNVKSCIWSSLMAKASTS